MRNGVAGLGFLLSAGAIIGGYFLGFPPSPFDAYIAGVGVILLLIGILMRPKLKFA